MDRNKVITLLLMTFIVTSLTFQNCSEMESNPDDSTIRLDNPQNGNGTLTPDNSIDPRVIPAYFVNKDLNLDNVGLVDSNSPGTFSIDYSVGSSSPDKFFFETEYLATYESTLVTIGGENNLYLFKVESDACTASKEFTTQDQIDFQEQLQLVYSNATTNVPQIGDIPKVGCSFPRLALSVGDVSKTDLNIFLSSKTCTPPNSVFVTDVGGEPPAQVIASVVNFFKDHIDSICLTTQ